MTTTRRRRVTTAESRLREAEERAFLATRALKRTRATLRGTRLTLGHVLSDLDAARSGSAALQRVLRRLAARHLGEGASRRERDALVDRWLGEDRRQPHPELTVEVDPLLDAIGNLLGRLFGEEDDHG